MKKNSKDTVTLRQRKRPNGNVSLYLDIYSNGRRKYEYLKLYLVPETNRDAKVRNKETMEMANSILAQRIMESHTKRLGIDDYGYDDICFYDYLDSIISRKSGTTRTSWENCRSHLMRYEPDRKIPMKSITEKWVRGFRNYLDNEARQWDIDTRKRNVPPTPLSQGTKALMFQKLCSMLNEAVKAGVIGRNPSDNVERFKEPESDREFLTIEELKRLIKTPAPDEAVGKAFLFSCLTGLRWSDISELRWSEVQRMGESTRLVFRQKKTGGLEYLDINSQAAELMGERHEEESLVFPDLTVVQTARMAVTAWVKAAGINKHITFHCGRHTFAVMMLELGTDIYTLSKLLGHRCLETTQVYAKILDKTKQSAVARIPDIL